MSFAFCYRMLVPTIPAFVIVFFRLCTVCTPQARWNDGESKPGWWAFIEFSFSVGSADVPLATSFRADFDTAFSVCNMSVIVDGSSFSPMLSASLILFVILE